MCGSINIHNLSLRGGSGSGRRGNPSCLEGGGRGCLFAYWFTVDRHGLRPRDYKVGEGCPRDDNTLFVIARRPSKRPTRQSIVSRATRSTCLFGYWFTVDRHGLAALAMTRSGEDAVCGEKCSVRADNHIHSLSLQGGHASDRRGNPSCLGGEGRVCLFAYWITVDRHGLAALAMTRWGNKGCTTPSGSQGR